MNPILAFWTAYVVTRPVGASFADWFGKPVALHGLGYGSGTVAAVLAVLIFFLVAYLGITHADVQKQAGAVERARQRRARRGRVR